MSDNANAILVVVHKYTKFAHFVPLRHPFTAPVARLFMDKIYRLHGLPKSIILDRDRIFTSKLWQLLFQMAGIQLRMSSSYHPQTDIKPRESSSALKHFSDASSMLVHPAGVNGFHSLSFGTTLVPIPPLAEHHLRSFMVISLACWELMWQQLPPCRTCNIGWRSVNS